MTIYLYISPEKIDREQLERVYGRLVAKPEHHEPNGDNVPSITFSTIGSRRGFSIEDCTLKSIDKSILLDLNKNDFIMFTILKEESKSIREQINSRLEVYDIKLANNRALVDIKMINQCETKDWRRLAMVVGLYAIVIIIGAVGKRKGN